MTRQEEEQMSNAEPTRDPPLGAMLRGIESDWGDPLTLARVQQRIATSVRQRIAARRRALEPSWWDWIAKAARPLPIGVAAILLVAAVAVLARPTSPALDPDETATVTPATILSTAFASDAGSDAVLNALIPPTSRDSLLARAFRAPVAIGQ